MTKNNHGQPIYAPAGWPVTNIVATVNREHLDEPIPPISIPIFSWRDHLGSMTSSFRNFILGYMAVYWMYDDNTKYPAYGDARVINPDWMIPIILRNIIGRDVHRFCETKT